MRKSIVALLLLSVVLVLVSCLNKPVIIKPETTTNEIELNTHDTETICTTTSSSDNNPIEHPVVVYYSELFNSLVVHWKALQNLPNPRTIPKPYCELCRK